MNLCGLRKCINLSGIKTDKVGLCAKVYENICDRYSTLESKCSAEIVNLSDCQILNEKREFKILESDYTNLRPGYKIKWRLPLQICSDKGFIVQTSERKKLKDLMELFKINLENEITQRDLSDEKIRNASTLGIKLQKYKGYDSATDFYTLRLNLKN